MEVKHNGHQCVLESSCVQRVSVPSTFIGCNPLGSWLLLGDSGNNVLRVVSMEIPVRIPGLCLAEGQYQLMSQVPVHE